MKIKRTTIAGLFIVGALGLFGATAPAVLAPALAQEEEGGERRRSETLDPAVAQVLQRVFEMMQNDQYREALAELNKLINDRGNRMKAFDLATTLELRASTKVNLEDYRGALQDFQAALNANGLPPERNNNLRYFIAQLHFQLQDYQAAIRGLNEWINSARAAGQPVDANAYYLLAAAYTQISPPNYRAAMQPAEQSVEALSSPRKSNYDLLNLVYSELGENNKRTGLLERMINNWPGERSYWTQLSGLYAQQGKDGEAFSVLEVAYRAGLLRTESEMLSLIQYYSFYENPYRGAKVMERELAAGSINRNVRNLTTLSQLWSQAREHKRAIPVLQEASRMSDTGELSFRLGQVLLADEQYANAERALRAALNKGGMTQRMTGDTWLLLGTAVFSQAGPEDRQVRTRAREAFVRATNYTNTAAQARQWVTYIDAIADTERRQDELERVQAQEARRAEIERARTTLQVCRLQGRNAEECEEIEARLNALERQQAQGGGAQQGESQGAAPAAPAQPDAPAVSDETEEEDAGEDTDEADTQ